jgi:DNA-binding MarR family transcriptional regulator
MKLRKLASTAGNAAEPARPPARARIACAPATGHPEPNRTGIIAVSAAREDVPQLAVLETIEHLRRLRTRYSQHKLDDVAWDLLLELLRAERLRQRLSVSGLAISVSGVSPTTSLRRINELAARQYIERIADPQDARRDFVSLTAKSRALLGDYLSEANVYVSALTA